MAKKRSRFLHGRRIDPAPITSNTTLANLVDESFLAYNAARLRESCQLFTQKMLEPEVTVGLSLTGALTPAGLGILGLLPLIQAGLAGWFPFAGAHRSHHAALAIGRSLHLGQG